MNENELFVSSLLGISNNLSNKQRSFIILEELDGTRVHLRKKRCDCDKVCKTYDWLVR
jgi:hypothetical protein